jgi:hypothetical protein
MASVANVVDYAVPTTQGTLIVYPPIGPGNFEVQAYLRVVAETTVTFTVSWTDSSAGTGRGPTPTPYQALTFSGDYPPGSYEVNPVTLNTIAGDAPIVVSAMATVADAAFMSATLEAL